MTRILASCLLLAVATACLSPGERRAKKARETVLDTNDVGAATRAILELRDLKRYRSDPVEALRQLDQEMRATASRKLAAAIAELAYLESRRATGGADFTALAATVRFSYAYLFDPKLVPEPSSYNAQFRDMCDLYNAALADWIRASKTAPNTEKHRLNMNWYTGTGKAEVTRNDLALPLSSAGTPPVFEAWATGSGGLAIHGRATATDRRISRKSALRSR